jgi:hypothetical protein
MNGFFNENCKLKQIVDKISKIVKIFFEILKSHFIFINFSILKAIFYLIHGY